ncbi:MAG: DNA polymerase I [Micavibrio aeruginosavorus]|uniref:DNA polymerase I n=1 Tax=Micavibrio aeruginosavorus TaxID=349221 RepID=A0A2W5PMH9_9BACT|nr:MAG: DNA polymerase I [Micavibrio aeruginosavorus]
MATSKNELILIDGSGYIFRAYYAMAYAGKSTPMTNPQGTPVGAVYGFSSMLIKLLKEHSGARIAVVFDAARKNFRYDLYDQYKSNRSETPEDLIPQFPLVRKATSAFGLPGLELDGYEADDLIATYARQAAAKGENVIIISSDKDLMQVVNDNIVMLDPMKDKIIDRAGVFEKFGVGPEKVIDVQSLIGDSSDNVPGVPGIGPKTAAQLIDEFGSLENLLEKAGDIKQEKRRQSLIDNADMARLSKKLVTLVDTVPVPVPLDEIKPYEAAPPALTEFFKEQGFKSLLNRIGETAATEGMVSEYKSTKRAPEKTSDMIPEALDADPELPPIAENKYTLIQDMDVLRQWIARAYETGFLAIDTETTSLTPSMANLVGISLCANVGEAAYLPLGHSDGAVDLLGGGSAGIKQIPMKEAIAALKPLLEDPSVLKVGHNIKYDWQMLALQGIHMSPCDDTMLMSYTLDGTSNSNSMDEISKRVLDHEPIKYDDVTGTGKSRITFDLVPLEKARDYAAEDADITARFYHHFKPRLARESMASVYEDIERPLIPVIAQMEMTGIKVDRAILNRMSGEFGKKLIELEAEIQKIAGTQFNVGSPKQIGEVLFDQMGLPGGSKTKTGQWSTDVGVLEDLARQGHEIVKKILEWRGLAKLKSTYTDALQEQINPRTGRVHTSFSMAGTSTGRLASSDPNLQNIPIRSEEGRKIREAFIAEEGYVLLSVDYSQVELRLAAEMAGVKALKQAFRDDVDIHALTASQVFGIPLDQITPDVRRQAKAVNFGIIYGISGWGLASQLNISPAEASNFIKKYLSAFSEIQDYMERTKEEARKFGYVRTLLGRKCYIMNINASNAGWRAGAERQAINAPLQGTAADIMKKAMIKIPPALTKADLGARMLLQVHDELIFEVPEKELEQSKALIKTIMENVVALDVPLVAEAGSGHSWGQAH